MNKLRRIGGTSSPKLCSRPLDLLKIIDSAAKTIPIQEVAAISALNRMTALLLNYLDPTNALVGKYINS